MKYSDIQHKAWYLLMKEKLYWAPIGEPKNVLDVVRTYPHSRQKSLL